MSELQLLGSQPSGRSLTTLDNIAAFTSATGAGPHDVPGSTTGVITVPPSGKIRVEGYTPSCYGSIAGDSMVFGVSEAAVVNGVQQAFAAVAGAVVYVPAIDKGQPAVALAVLNRTPGAQYVYKLIIWRLSGTGNPKVSSFAAGGRIFLDVTAR